ncbi:hypothetical protein MMC26_006701 [Xylographa opegraphella]|nr:hypothetical protein [Xylographa opegraphella]
MKFRVGKKKHEDGGDSQTTKPDETKDPSPGFGNFWRILSFGSRPEHVLLVIAIACAAASGVPLPVLNIVFGGLVGDFNNYFVPGNDVTESDFKSSISQSALYIVYLFIGKFVLTYVASFCFRVAGLRVSAAMRLQYLDSLFAQPIKKLDEVSTGTVANTITGSANTIQISISERLATLFQSLALVIAAFAIAFSYSWALTLATSSGIIFVIVVYSITTPFALKQMQRVEKADEKHATVAAETISSIRTVFALGAEPKMREKHTHWVNESNRHGMKLAPHIATQLSPMYFSIYACYALAFWFGLKLYRQGQIDNVNTVIIVFFSVLLVTSVMGGIYQPIANITKAISVSGNFFDIIDSDRVKSDGLRKPEVSPHGDLIFENVNFAYPSRPNIKVLDRFTAKFQKDKTTALVGPSGSGKSTVVGLLERWYTLENTPTSQPAQQFREKSEKNVSLEGTSTEDERQTERVTLSGTVSIESRNINDLELMWWRTQIGLVQQEPFLFNETIEENVAHGLIGTRWEDCDQVKRRELVTEACREASADEFINKLPKGYSTKVGESGIKLSGGQRQRIAIARSIIKQPAILILDEATSSIDVQGEKLVQEALDRASKNRTTIMIAHRLTTISKADHIIVLRNGANVEEGTHEHLLSLKDGLYSSLVRAQKLDEEENDPSSPKAEDSLTGIRPG